MTEEKLALGAMLAEIEEDSWSCWIRFILHIFSSSSMRTKLSDRERGASAPGPGLSALLIFADYASSWGRQGC